MDNEESWNISCRRSKSGTMWSNSTCRQITMKRHSKLQPREWRLCSARRAASRRLGLQETLFHASRCFHGALLVLEEQVEALDVLCSLFVLQKNVQEGEKAATEMYLGTCSVADLPCSGSLQPSVFRPSPRLRLAKLNESLVDLELAALAQLVQARHAEALETGCRVERVGDACKGEHRAAL